MDQTYEPNRGTQNHERHNICCDYIMMEYTTAGLNHFNINIYLQMKGSLNTHRQICDPGPQNQS